MFGKRLLTLAFVIFYTLSLTAALSACSSTGFADPGGTPSLSDGVAQGGTAGDAAGSTGGGQAWDNTQMDNNAASEVSANGTQTSANGTQTSANGTQTSANGTQTSAGGTQTSAGGTQASDGADTGVRPVFTPERERKYVDVEWKPLVCDKKVAPYKVDPSLSNVANLSQFGSFSAKQKQMLSGNGFFVAPAKEQQLFYIYENNQYLKLPSLITADSVLQVYHVFYDYSLRTLEYEYLLQDLEQLTDSMLKKSVRLYEDIKDRDVKAAALKNIAYFAVAQKVLEKQLPANMPDEALKLAEAESGLVEKQEGFAVSPIFGFKMDYSQYTPRGHYTRSHDFERFFKAMMWYGQVPFPLLIDKDNVVKLSLPETLQALLITYSIFTNGSGEADTTLWENIYDPTVFYVGKADDLTIYDYKNLLVKTFGQEPDPEAFTDSDKLDKLIKEAKKLPKPRIQPEWTSVNTPVGAQFRFMGQRYIPDSEILQKLVMPYIRPMPKGLDVMGVLGSDRAYALLTELYKEDKNWPEYPNKFNELKEKFVALPDETWRSNMYYGWLWVLKSFTGNVGKGYPSFMTNRAWRDKSLNTALASWAELRHDTILYGKQSGAEMGGGDEPPSIKGYVEPNIDAYERLLWLTKYSRENLSARQILPPDLKGRMLSFEGLLQFLLDCSVKELKNEELTKEEYERIQFYGGELEHLTSSFSENGLRWFEITSETDKNMALIADVHTSPGYYLEEGIGPASEIFAVVPIGGKLYLTRGAVFSYYEFVSGKRLTDEEWQKSFDEGKQPAMPEWIDSFTDRNGAKKKIPVPVDPYESYY